MAEAENKIVTPITIHESPSQVHIKLDGTNYRVWSKILEMHIAGRERKGYITGRKTSPPENDPNYDKWEAEDAQVKSWIINSMADNLVSHFVQYGTAKEVWDAVKRSYLDVSDSSQAYELMKRSFQLRQQGRRLVEYYNEMNSIFMDIDFRRPNNMKCTADVEELKKRTAEDRVYMFLAGLDHSLDQVRSRVLATSPLPSLEETFAMVRREDQRQLTMGAETHFEPSALAVKKPLILTYISQKTKEEGKRFRPRQFEYHPSNSGLMAVGTFDGEVVLLNPETGNIFSHISSNGNTKSVLGLCWLKNNPSKLLVGTENGSLRLYDINNLPQEEEDSFYNSSTVIFEDFEQELTSVHVNSTDDQFLASGDSEKVAIYDICSGKRLQLFTDMHRELINVAKFANHSPNLLVTSSMDRDVKMWDLRQKPLKPCYTSSSSRGNVMVCFSPDDLYLLVSSVDNEVKQLLAVDGRLHTNFEIGPTGSYDNYTRSYYMNGRDHIISGSCEEPVVRVCCAQTGRLLRNIYLEDGRSGSSVFVQSLKSDPFRPFHLAVLAGYGRPSPHWEIIKVNLLSSSRPVKEYP